MCPIGGTLRDKRPEVIAAFTVAELLLALLQPAASAETTGEAA